MAAKGYKISVYCRKGNSAHKDPYYKGVRLITLPTIKHKYFDTLAHTFLSVCRVIFTDTTIVYFCNPINSIFLLLPRLFGKKVIINVDGLEWKRAKWNKIGKFGHRACERLAALFAHTVIADSKGIQEYYMQRFKRKTCYISYGAYKVEIKDDLKILEHYGLKQRGYFLYVSRLEPENNAHIMINAYEKIKTEIPLIIVGSAPYAKTYIRELHATKDKRIKFLGAVYNEGYHALVNNSFVYLHGNEVGGTNPALLQAMAAGNCVVVNGVSFNKEVISDTGVWFEPGNPMDLKTKLEHLLCNPQEITKYRALSAERIRNHYNWEKITLEYESLFMRMQNSCTDK